MMRLAPLYSVQQLLDTFALSTTKQEASLRWIEDGIASEDAAESMSKDRILLSNLPKQFRKLMGRMLLHVHSLLASSMSDTIVLLFDRAAFLPRVAGER
jgi:hypothetical protein